MAVGAGATIGMQDTWLDGYGIIAYFLVPLAFIPFAAGAIASPRANRFVESAFTTPVRRRDWFVAKVLVLLTLAVAYYLALLPMMFVYVAHVGVPLLLQKLLWGDTRVSVVLRPHSPHSMSSRGSRTHAGRCWIGRQISRQVDRYLQHWDEAAGRDRTSADGAPQSAVPRGRLVYTGPTQNLGLDIDVFEERLIELLTLR
jgi:hypothetical protein